MDTLSRIPWFIGAPAAALGAVLLAGAINWFGASYFERSFLDEQGFVFTNVEDDGDTDAPSVPDAPTATPPADDEPTPTPPPQEAVLLSQGMFQDGAPGHSGNGNALLARTAEGMLVLRVEEFSVTNGPDLFVYLTTDPEGENTAAGLNLGRLLATDGNFNYDIPAEVDLSVYQSVVIWCRSFDVIFAYATLAAVE